jgi:DNA polymerase-3 subunit delta'
MTALAFAAALNCREMEGGGCGKCRSCMDIQKGTHPDVRVWKREKSVVHIGLIRELITSLSLKSYGEGYKVAILDEAEAMNQEAANSFLLTLEEPPPGSVLILVASNPRKIPETILSRCQRIYFQPLPGEILMDMLTSGGEVTEEEAATAVLLAEGSFSEALEFLDKSWRSDWESGLKLLEQIFKSGPETALASPVSDCQTREKADRLLFILERVIRLALRKRLGLSTPEGWSGPLSLLADNLHEGGFLGSMEAVYRARMMMEGNVNPRLVMEGIVLEIAAIAGKEVVTDREET